MVDQLPIVPTLEGEVSFNHDTETWVFDGLWAMTPQNLRTGIKSAFHYVHKDNKEASDPRSGNYSGFFMLKAADADQKVDENDIVLAFTEKDGNERVSGRGSNQYGSFTLEGKLQNGKLLLSKTYGPAPIVNTVPRARKRSPSTLASEKSANKQAPAKRPKLTKIRKKSQGRSKLPVLAPILRGNLNGKVWQGRWALNATLLEQGKSQPFHYQRQHTQSAASTGTVVPSSSSGGAPSITTSLAIAAPTTTLEALPPALDTSGPAGPTALDGTAACGPDSTTTTTTPEVTADLTNPEELANHLSGLFDGHFMIQMADSVAKIPETGVEMKFDVIQGESTRLSCICTGRNKIGKFQMKGFYTIESGVLECVKTYVYDKVAKKRAAVTTPRASSRAKTATPKALASRIARMSNSKPKPKMTTPKALHSKKTPPSAGRPRSIRKRVAPAYLRSEDRNNDAIMSRCAKVLRQLNNNKNALPFLQPVDHVLLKIPDYPIVIKHPMDLGTIKTKLDNGQYSSPRDFEHDVNLVFRNATLYNKPGNVVHAMCKALNKVFDRLYLPVKKAMLKREPKPKPKPKTPKPVPKATPKTKKKSASKKRQPKPGRKFAPRKKKESFAKRKKTASASAPRRRRRSEGAEIAQLRKELAAIKEWQMEQMAKPEPKAKPKPKKRAPPKPKALTAAEKHALSSDIRMLPGDKLTKVVNIISEKLPVSHNTDNQEIVIDIESLDTATLRQLQKFTRKHLSARNKKNPKQMEAMARKMNQGTQERIDFLKHQLERQKMQDDSSSDSSFDSDSDSGSEEILHLGGSSSTYY